MDNTEAEWLDDPELRDLATQLAASVHDVETALDEIDAIHAWANEMARRHSGRVLSANRDFVELAFDHYPAELAPLVAESPGEMELFEAAENRAARLMIYLRQP